MARDCARISVIECETELGDMAADAKLFDAEHSVVLDEDGKVSCLTIGPCEAHQGTLRNLVVTSRLSSRSSPIAGSNASENRSS